MASARETDIRRAAPGDEGVWSRAVAKLVPAADRDHELASHADLAAALADDRCYLYLALAGSETVGLLSAYRVPDVEAGGSLVYLYDLEVDSEHRRRGHGRALVAALVDRCRADGVRRIWAGTEGANVAARRSFEATGAELEGASYVEYEWDLDDDEEEG